MLIPKAGSTCYKMSSDYIFYIPWICRLDEIIRLYTLYTIIYLHGIVVLCFVVVESIVYWWIPVIYLPIFFKWLIGSGSLIRLSGEEVPGCWLSFNSPSAAYMCQWTRSALVQVMAWCLFGTKPLPESTLAYCQLDFWEQISVKFELEFYHFYSRKSIWNCHLPQWWPFCQGGDE